MADYKVIFTRSALRELVKGLEATMSRRIRVGDYRVAYLVYSVNDNARVVDIRVVRHRNDVYR